MTKPNATSEILALTTKIVSAHIGHNPVPVSELPRLIRDVFQVLAGVEVPVPELVRAARPQPAVPVKKSITPGHLVCLEDGKKLKMLKRHLKVAFNLTPEQYRERWALPADYPMVAPDYAQKRASIAKQLGLGTRSVSRGRKLATA